MRIVNLTIASIFACTQAIEIGEILEKGGKPVVANVTTYKPSYTVSSIIDINVGDKGDKF